MPFPDFRSESGVFRAQWILPVDQPPIRDGVLAWENGRIVSVESTRSEGVQLPCHDCVVLPSFINAHTHLEFSSLAKPLGRPGMPFPDWIRLVLQWRREREERPDASQCRKGATLTGIDELVRGGSRGVGEIATMAESLTSLNTSTLSGVLFWELIGLSSTRVAAALESARALLSSEINSSAALRMGLSPHAPYTVHPDLLRRTIDLAVEKDVPVAMHLAETPDELQLLWRGNGPLRDLLVDLNVWQEGIFPGNLRPLDYLRMLAEAPRALIIHGNFLDDDERCFLAAHHERMTVVYCPRTHAYFDHPQYPLRQMLDLGVRVALGTDSKASNPDLSMLEEVRFAARQHPDVPPVEILRMGTIHAAQALGLEHELGSLAIGKRSAVQALPLAARNFDNPYGWME